MAQVKRLLVEVARGTIVLNADDQHCLGMAKHGAAQHLCRVSTAPQNTMVDAHVRSGGRAPRLTEPG